MKADLPRDVSENGTEQEPPGRLQEEDPVPGGRRVRVLIVEDNPGIARVVRSMLDQSRTTQFAVDTADCLATALAKLRQHPFDLVLVDLVLPDSQGISAVQILTQARPSLPVVVLTGVDDEVSGEAAIEAGAQDYLVKGAVDTELLCRTVNFAIQRVRSEQALRESREELQNLVESLPDGVILYGEEGVSFANPAAVRLLGAGSSQELRGRPVGELLHCPAEPDIAQRLMEVIGDGYQFPGFIEGECRQMDGSGSLACELLATPLYQARGVQGQLILRDITPRKEAEKYLRLATAVFESSTEGMMIWDAEGRIEMINEAFTEITGYGNAEAVGKDARFLDSGSQGARFFEEMGRVIRERGSWRGDFYARRKDGEVFIARLALSGVHDEQGRINNFVGIFSDVTEEREKEAAVQHLANHDPLTGLPNRRLLHDRLAQALADRHREPRERNRVALFFVDLDDFKGINDSGGHDIGDQVLGAVAERVRHSLREGDTVARFGGDEFVVLLKHLPDEETAEELARKVAEVIARPIPLREASGSEGAIEIAASIGIAIAPRHGDDPDTLLARADQAMYQSKEAGKGGYYFF